MKMKTTLKVLLIMELLDLSYALSKQHFFVNQSQNWKFAKKYCRNNYDGLSTFTDASEEQQFLIDAANQMSNAWVGLHRDDSDVWFWLEHTTGINISWDTSMNQPNDGDEYCGFFHKDHQKLHDWTCDQEQAFYCMTMSALIPDAKSWDDALEYCRRNYDDLASLSSKFKMTSALGKISQAQTEYVWAGLRFLAGEWAWISGDDFNVDSTAMPECPVGNLRCGALNRQTQKLMPVNCTEKLNFICQ